MLSSCETWRRKPTANKRWPQNKKKKTQPFLTSTLKSRAGARGRPTPRQCQAATQGVECTLVQQRTRLPLLVPDLNRGTTGMDPWTSTLTWTPLEKTWDQSRPTKVIGRDRGTSQAHLETQEEKLMGIQRKLQGKTTNSPWSNQPKESTKEFAKIPS